MRISAYSPAHRICYNGALYPSPMLVAVIVLFLLVTLVATESDAT